MSRQSLIVPFAVLFTCLAVLTACSKKKSDNGGGGGDDTAPPGPTPGAPAAVSSDYILFAHVNAKQITGSAIFTEVKQALAKSGGSAIWDEIEEKAAKELGGIKPTEIDSATVCLSDLSNPMMPKFVVIVTASKAIDPGKLSLLGPQAKPDARGFYTADNTKGMLVHFPDPKTMAILSSDVAQQYLGGYAKNRAGWPMTAELSKAASGHTLYAVAQLSKLPRELLGSQEIQMAGPLLKAQTITLTADLKGKELSVAGRATFPDAATAGQAKEMVQGLLGIGANFVDNFMKGKDAVELAPLMPAVKEAHRALTEARVEVSGSDLMVSGSYKVNFDIGKMIADAVPKVQEAAKRSTAQNNLKQIGIALHNMADIYQGSLPVHAVGANGQPLRNPTDKQLLSWRVAILPYIEQDNLYRQFKLDEPWDSPNNKKLIEQMPKIYAPVNKPGKPGYTHMQMVIGPKALQPVGTKMPASFLDGTSNTIAVVEAADPVIWTKPDDVMLPGNALPKDLKKKFGGQFPGGFNVLLWDGSVRFLRDTISDQTLSLALNPNDGQPLGSDW